MKSSNSSAIPTPKTRTEVKEWINRIVSIQQNVSPDKIEEIKRNIVSSARALNSATTAFRTERVARLASSSMISPLIQMRETSSAPPTFGNSNSNNNSNDNAMTSYVTISNQIRDIITSNNDNSNNNNVNNNNNNNIDERLAILENEAFEGTVFQNIENYSSLKIDDELLKLLKDLEIEPNNDNDIKSKFLLFEEFSKNVDIIRSAIYQFWIDNKDQFDNHVRLAIDKEIKNIDNNEAQSIQDDPNKWFVYYMVKGSHKNNQIMTEFLRNLGIRLELLAQTDLECPICLQSLNENNQYIMQCCHRMCIDCYSHWLELKGNQVFCPICKGVNEAFLPEIINNLN